MSFGPTQKFTVSITSGLTLTSAVDLGDKSFSRVYLEVPTMASGTNLYLQGANDADDTYRRICHEAANSASVQAYDYTIGSATTQRMVPVPAHFRYVKVELSTAMTATPATFNLHVSD